MRDLGIFALIGALIVVSAWFKWWRCGEMYPHAVVACFVSAN